LGKAPTMLVASGTELPGLPVGHPGTADRPIDPAR
jgi:hypothetical protein